MNHRIKMVILQKNSEQEEVPSQQHDTTENIEQRPDKSQ